MFTAFAPGRLCLLGEHCDWAGGASLVVPMDRGILVHVQPGPTLRAETVLNGAPLEWAEGQAPGALFLVPAVAEVLGALLGAPVTGTIRIEADLPAGRGFSSSAALCVALVRALLAAAGRPVTPQETAELAWRAEHEVAGVACGRLDPLACAHGLPLFLEFPSEPGPPTRVEPMPARLDLAVGAFRLPRDTHTILNTLSLHFRGEVPLRDWEATQRVGAVRGAIEGFAAQAWHGRLALLENDLRALGGAMDACQEIYEEELMATLPALHAPGLLRSTRALKKSGALGAKFSGAGGDGSVVGLYPPGGAVRDGVVALDALGLESFAVEVWCAV